MLQAAVLLGLLAWCGCSTPPPQGARRALTVEELRLALVRGDTVPEGIRWNFAERLEGLDWVENTCFFTPGGEARHVVLRGTTGTSHPHGFVFAYDPETGEAIWLSDSPEGFSRLMRKEGIRAEDGFYALLIAMDGLYLTSTDYNWFRVLESANDVPVLADGRRGSIPVSVAEAMRPMDLVRAGDGSYAAMVHVFMNGSVYERTLRVTEDAELTFSDRFVCKPDYK